MRKNSMLLDEIVEKLGQSLPPGAASLKNDFDRNAKATVQAALGKMDLVTREEFDIQAALLERTREKLDRLEKLFEKLPEEKPDSGNL